MEKLVVAVVALVVAGEQVVQEQPIRVMPAVTQTPFRAQAAVVALEPLGRTLEVAVEVRAVTAELAYLLQ